MTSSSSTKFVSNPPRVTVMLASSISIATAAWSVLTWTATDGSDYEAMRSGTRLVVPAAGRYVVAGQVSFGASTTGHRYVQVRKNSGGSPSGGIPVVQQRVPAAAGGNATLVNAAGDAPALADGDYLELFAWQNSGGALALNSGPGETVLSVRWVALD